MESISDKRIFVDNWLLEGTDSFIISYISSFIVINTPGNSAHAVAEDELLIESLNSQIPAEVRDALETLGWFCINNAFEVVETDQGSYIDVHDASLGEEEILESIRLDAKHEGFVVDDVRPLSL